MIRSQNKILRIVNTSIIFFTIFWITSVLFYKRFHKIDYSSEFNLRVEKIKGDISGIRINDSILIYDVYNLDEKRVLYMKDIKIGDRIYKERNTDKIIIFSGSKSISLVFNNE